MDFFLEDDDGRIQYQLGYLVCNLIYFFVKISFSNFLNFINILFKIFIPILENKISSDCVVFKIILNHLRKIVLYYRDIFHKNE